jgi:hypothetical protein
MTMKHQFNELRVFVRSLLMEIAPALAAGRTLDINGLKVFLQQKGVFGQEDNIISIVEGDPTQKVLNDMSEYVSFHNIDTSMDQMDAEDMLRYYLEWNGLNIHPNEVLAFSISETGS